MRRRSLVYLALSMAVVLLAVTCGPAEEATPTPTPTRPAPTATPTPTPVPGVPTPTPTKVVAKPTPTATATPTPKAEIGEELKVALGNFGYELLDPVQGLTLEQPYLSHAYDTVVGANSAGQLTTDEGVVSAWETNEDATVWTFTVRDGMVFDDGSLLESKDVGGSMEAKAGPASRSIVRGALRHIISYEYPDSKTLIVTLDRPDSILLEALGPQEGDVNVWNIDYYWEVGPENYLPNGAGPWNYVSHSLGENIIYERDPNYWNVPRRAGFEKLTIDLVPEMGTRIALGVTEQADIVNVDSRSAKEAEEKGARIQRVKGVVLHAVAYYHSWDPEYANYGPIGSDGWKIRKALTLAVNVQEILDSIYVGYGQCSNNYPTSPSSAGYDPSVPCYEYDPELAKQLLEEAGWWEKWADVGPIQVLYPLTYSGNPEAPQYMSAVAAYWRAIGLNVKEVAEDYAAWRLRTQEENYGPPVVVVNQQPWARPSAIRNYEWALSHEGTSLFYWNPDQADEWLRVSKAMTDPIERAKYVQMTTRALHDEYAAIPIAWKDEVFIVSSRIGKWEPVPFTPTYHRYNTARLK